MLGSAPIPLSAGLLMILVHYD